MKKIIITLLTWATVYGIKAQNQLYNNGALIHISNGSTLWVNGDLTNVSGSDFSNNGTATITGNITNNQVMVTYTGKLIFNNTAAQVLNGTGEVLTKDLEINNTAGITLATKLKVDGACQFTNGIVTALDNTKPLLFTPTATITSPASDASHVNGYVVKEGIGSFSYPVGDGTKYQRVDINPTANATGIRVKYNASNAGTAPFIGATPLLYYNTLEYWDIVPIGTASASVTIYWDNYQNIGIGNTADLRVAHLSAGSWLNEGAASVTGNISAGSVTSNAINTWSQFTLGSTSISSTLPVNWLSVNGNVNANKQPVITWRVNEQNVSDYQVEKSVHINNFTNIATLGSKGNGDNDYTYTELGALQNTAYYRVKQTDKDGKFTYSSVIKLSSKLNESLIVYPTPFKESFTIISTVAQTARLMSVDGKLVQRMQLKEGNNYIHAGTLSKGIYILHTANNSVQRIIKH